VQTSLVSSSLTFGLGTVEINNTFYRFPAATPSSTGCARRARRRGRFLAIRDIAASCQYQSGKRQRALRQTTSACVETLHGAALALPALTAEDAMALLPRLERQETRLS
jgi:hypothetical protein